MDRRKIFCREGEWRLARETPATLLLALPYSGRATTCDTSTAFHNRRTFSGKSENPCPSQFDPFLLSNRPIPGHTYQFTNLRNLTLFTKPNIRKIDHVFEPPELIKGNGIPVIGILPITIPTFTNT